MTILTRDALTFDRRSALKKLFAVSALTPAYLAAEDKVVARDAWVRPPAPSKDMTAAYMELENHTGQKRAVVSASSDLADKVELHEMKMEGKMMHMSPVKQINIPANGNASLKPGGFHIMMFGLKRRPAEGDTVRVILKLDDGTTVPVTATVRQQKVD